MFQIVRLGALARYRSPVMSCEFEGRKFDRVLGLTGSGEVVVFDLSVLGNIELLFEWGSG